jgi:ATP-dependent RNA helicase DeaD
MSLEKFQALGLSDTIIEALATKGFEEPTSIQEKVIPLLLTGNKDIVGQAQTGTGKTAAFGLPLLERLEDGMSHVQALVLTPTRELAIQVSEEIHSFRGKKGVHISPIYGGQSIEEQIRKLKKGLDIVVGTPGRIIDLINRGALKLDCISYLILDEADEMLNMGFIEDVETIISHCPKDRRTLLFSATMPDQILALARRYMKDFDIIQTETNLTTDLTEQIYFEVSESDKVEALCRIIDMEPFFYGLIFCRTKVDVDRLSNKLTDRGYEAEGLHGDLSQYQRERIMDKFKNQRINILVATDVAARGIDVADLTHVINYSLPQDPESYVHRIGRTGRAGKEGTAITFVTPAEYRKLAYIKKITKTDIRKQKIPDIQAVVSRKREMLKEDLLEVHSTEDASEFTPLAAELLENSDPLEMLASILKYAFEDELSEKSYSEIRNVPININNKGTTRLFVALGRAKGMDARKLVQFIRSETNVPDRNIRDVRVYDDYSFNTVPYEEAEHILQIFRDKKKGKKSLVERAKDKQDGR